MVRGIERRARHHFEDFIGRLGIQPDHPRRQNPRSGGLDLPRSLCRVDPVEIPLRPLSLDNKIRPMTTLLIAVAHLLTLLMIIAVAYGIYKGGGGALLTAVVTLFLLTFGTVSVVEAGLAAEGSALSKFALVCFMIVEALLIPAVFSAS